MYFNVNILRSLIILFKKIDSSDNISEKAAIELQQELTKVFVDLEACDADKAPSRAAKILCGLGFSPEDQKKPTKFAFWKLNSFF
jgi:hypothetical protein